MEHSTFHPCSIRDSSLFSILMRNPSSRILANTVALYRFVPSQDPDAGVGADPYILLASVVPCSVQPHDPEREFDATGKVVESRAYDLVFATDHGLLANDKAVWVDGLGTSRNLFVSGSADQAGRGS